MKPSTAGVEPRRFDPETHLFEPEESVSITGPVLHLPDPDICRYCGKLEREHEPKT